MPQSSTLNSTPPNEVTASTIVKQLCLRAISQRVFASDNAPVEVSACTKATKVASGVCCKVSSKACGSTALPQVPSTTTAFAPIRSTFSIIRAPKTPFRQTTTVSFSVIKLTKHASIPAEPGAEIAMV